jgi:hypothetical protein
MGLALSRETFDDWVERWSPFIQEKFFADFEQATGIQRDKTHWAASDGPASDEGYLKLGSYTRYGIFTLFLTYLIEGDFESELEEDENIEREALQSFRAQLAPASLKIDYASHFTETGDSDTVFVPAMFAEPFCWDESWVASMPAAILALESLAKSLDFSLEAVQEPEETADEWDAVATSRNIARDIYLFFKKSGNACVAYE